jgi:hypothetical protein
MRAGFHVGEVELLIARGHEFGSILPKS